MRYSHYDLNIYPINFYVISIELSEKVDYSKKRKLLNKLNNIDVFDKDDIDNIFDCIKNYKNCGTTYSNTNTNQICIVLINLDNRRNNIIAHEKRHAEDRIIEWCKLEDREACAYLAGYLQDLIDKHFEDENEFT